MKFSKFFIPTVFAITLLLASGSTKSYADPILYSTSDPSHWSVATWVGGGLGDGQLSSFNNAIANGFNPSQAIPSRAPWIANNSTGTNGWMGDWTFFVFRQTFDMTGYDPTTANLKFQWAADDSGEGYAFRGTWTPKFSLNGGSLIEYPGSPTPTYGWSSEVDLSSGFISGLNTIDFYVEGNGVTDGFALQTIGFTADSSTNNAVPEPATMLLFGAGLAGLGLFRKRI